MKEKLLKREENLSPYAFKSYHASRIYPFKEDVRPPFYRDIDRIIYSNSYTRYMNKTQVFSYEKNDHLTTRMVHVQLVSKIARTIGRLLNLNEDLIEAASLAHDLGHSPLGHLGESFLDELSLKHTGKHFHHNLHSVRLLKDIDKNGIGRNITVEVLDAVMCHNGETLRQIYEPMPKTTEQFLKEYELSYYHKNFNHRPKTLEGCVLAISDVIAYVGRDVEDAIRLKLIVKEDVPVEVRNVLGTKNSEIINTLILDIVNESLGKNYIKMSDEVYNALKLLKDFNYKNIYSKAKTEEEINSYKDGMNRLFYKYLNDLKRNNLDSIIYRDYLDDIDTRYLDKTTNEEIVIDYLAGMTDNYFKEQIENER